MSRTRAPHRLDTIIEAATQVFILQGYRLASMDEIAERAGVSPATLYLYAGNKAALFELVVRRAFGDPAALDVPLPYQGHAETGPVEAIWTHLVTVARFEELEHAARRKRAADPRTEVRLVAGELYLGAWRCRRGIKLIEKCARDWPELHALFYRQFRERVIGNLTRFIAHRVAAGQFRPVPDAAVAARAVLELVAWFAFHRYTAADESTIPDDLAEATVLQFITDALVPA
jgi:AcrR family transcriptional regulator